MYLKSSHKSMMITQTITRNLPIKPLEIIVIISLTFLLFVAFPGKSYIYALPSGGGHTLGSAIGGNGGIGGNGAISSSTNCIGTDILHPSVSNCASPNVVHPANAPNTAIVQPSNCNIPTSVHHTNTPSTVVVHPTNCPPISSGSSNSLTVNNV
jgi:hypothetical protein